MFFTYKKIAFSFENLDQQKKIFSRKIATINTSREASLIHPAYGNQGHRKYHVIFGSWCESINTWITSHQIPARDRVESLELKTNDFINQVTTYFLKREKRENSKKHKTEWDTNKRIIISNQQWKWYLQHPIYHQRAQVYFFWCQQL